VNQHDFVKECLAFYEEEGLTPEKGWDKAHYPAPENQGDETIWLSHYHHQIQGLLQSREYGQCCFFSGDAKRFLTRGPFVSGWFELWDIYDEYKGAAGRANGRKNVELGRGFCAPGVASRAGKRAVELGLGIHAPGMASAAGKKAVKLGVGVHGRSSEKRSEDSRKGGKNQPLEAKIKGAQTSNAQRYMNTDPRHPPYISNAGGLTHWQKARGIDTSMRVKLT
jgi:hypothetical protein